MVFIKMYYNNENEVIKQDTRRIILTSSLDLNIDSIVSDMIRDGSILVHLKDLETNDLIELKMHEEYFHVTRSYILDLFDFENNFFK